MKAYDIIIIGTQAQQNFAAYELVSKKPDAQKVAVWGGPHAE